MPHPRTQLRALVTLTQQLEAAAPRALAEIARRMSDHDGYGRGRSDGAGRGTSELTSVERAADGLMPLDRDWHAILDAFGSAAAEMHRAITICNKYSERIDSSTLRCTGGQGEAGHLEWGRPDCSNIQEDGRRTGLCSACRQRRDTWRRNSQRAA